jgi:hypothetical protein
VKLIILNRGTIKQHFCRLGCWEKFAVARSLASRFPELEWRMPKRRKAWDREDHIASVFDALATVVAFEEQQSPSEIER